MADRVDKREAALAWAGRGFKVFPLRPGTKLPMDKAWYAVASNDAETVRRMWTDPVMGWGRDYNIGVLTDDMIVVDIDMKHGKDGLKSYLALDLPLDTLLVKTPSGGYHAYFNGPSRSLSVGRLGSGLDIRSHHGFVIAPGSTLGVGEPYALVNDAPVRSAPAALIDKLDAPRPRSDDQHAAVELDTDAQLHRGQQYLHDDAPVGVEGNGGDATAYRVAATLKDIGCSEASALDLMLEHWNERCSPPWVPDELQKKVENAYRYGVLPPGASDPSLDYEGVAIDVLLPTTTPTAAPQGSWYYHGDPWDSNTAWLYEGVLPQTGVALLVAPSGSGKTFVAVDLVASLASGRPWFGISPEEKGGAFYLTAESLWSLKARLAALGEAGGRLPIAAQYVSGLGAKDALQSLLNELAVEGRRMMDVYGVVPRMVVLDTLSASGLLLDEDDNAQAAAALAALGRASQALGMLFLVVHHPPKNGSGPRGAGAIANSADYVLEIVRHGKSAVREMELIKGRDAPTRSLGGFTLVPVIVGQNGKGRPIESCTVSTGIAVKREETASTHTQLLVECVEWGLVEEPSQIEGRAAVELEAVRQAFKERKPGSRDRGNIANAFKAALVFAEETGILESFVYAGRSYIAQRDPLQ